MAIACAEASAALIATLRSRFSNVVAIRGSPSIICDDDPSPGFEAIPMKPPRVSATIYLVTLESPLISEDTPHVEIAVERDGLRFKPWRDV